VSAALDRRGSRYAMFNQREFEQTKLALDIRNGRTSGTLRVGNRAIDLADVTGTYSRLMDADALPEILHEPVGSERRRRCRALHEAMWLWCETAPSRVVNRPSVMASNGSKPYQAQLIRGFGFAVPDTLVTSDVEAVRGFRRRHQKVVYKSVSGMRSIVRLLDGDAEARLDRIAWCPVQFQEYVEGTDVRVHVVGDEVFATEVRSNVTDYRYAGREAGGHLDLTPRDLDTETERRCVAMTAGLGLSAAGIDLKFAPDGRVYCFEVNPSPAFSFFEAWTGQPIADAIARFLSAEP
jgi:glutathione synthase/RimK-type ligase-like ATP-grasp enzyme